MDNILCTYDSISLDEMGKVRLMNRIDTKYITTLPVLELLLQMAKEDYVVQSIDNEFSLPYYTLYYDTSDANMYMEHLRGRKRRYKIRIRRYEISNITFLEVKKKNNKGRTKKKRITYNPNEHQNLREFIEENSPYSESELSKRIENRFSRVTLVNRNLTERLTIDTQLKFHNFVTNNTCAIEDLVIIELKRDGNTHSPILEKLRQLHIHPAKFSKYCMGMALTDAALKRNRFKPRLHNLDKLLCQINRNICF